MCIYFKRKNVLSLQMFIPTYDPVFLAFDVFNVTRKHSFQERKEQINVLAKHYGNAKTSKWVTVLSQLQPTFLAMQLMNKQLRHTLLILIAL